MNLTPSQEEALQQIRLKYYIPPEVTDQEIINQVLVMRDAIVKTWRPIADWLATNYIRVEKGGVLMATLTVLDYYEAAEIKESIEKAKTLDELKKALLLLLEKLPKEAL